MDSDARQIAEFFDRECCAAVDPGASVILGSAGVTRVLVDALVSHGLAGATVLELGSGDGSLSRELVGLGALRVTGIDLSPASVAHATAAAKAAGLHDRLHYAVGDGALSTLEPSDLVVSQKVVCCYPRPDRLLGNSLPAARATYALVMPESRGLFGLATHLLVALENGWRRLQRDPFRAYVHDLGRVDAQIRAAGFEQRFARRHWSWLVLVYELGDKRTQSPS